MPTMRFKSTADYATSEIQRLILQGELKPGERLDQVDLAAKLDVSRHPVRQAIERLAERGFIELRPHRSAVVAAISVSDMDELYDARAQLEALAIRDAWERIAADTDRLSELERKARAIDPLADLDAFMENNRAFHLAMVELCANRHIRRVVTTLYDLSERYQRLALQSRVRATQSDVDHAAIVAAAAAGDVERLIASIRAHNAGTQRAVRLRLGEQPQTPASEGKHAATAHQ